MNFATDNLGGRCWRLGVATAGMWLFAMAPAYHFFNMAGIEAVSVSAASCLFAGWLTFWLAARLSQPGKQAIAVLLGTFVRGIFALIGALFMQFLLGLPIENYLIWLGLFYLVSLALETMLMLGPETGCNG